MTYRVIKRIKGRQYIYEQSSYRVGNKVKTKSKYIGPVDPRGAGGSVQTVAPKEPEQATMEVGKYKNAQEFAAKLGLEFERPQEYGNVSVALKRYPDGKITIKVPKSFDIDSPKTQKLIWHEIGHYFDEAHYHGGRGQVNALYTTGKYSTPNKEILRKHTDYINKDRIVPEIAISVRYKGERFKDLKDLIKAKNVDRAFKEKIKYIVARQEAKFQDYLKQRIELFADGFANYVENRSLISNEAPELAKIYDDVFKDREELKDFFTQVNTTKKGPDTQDKSKHLPQTPKTKPLNDRIKAGKSDFYSSQKEEVDLSKPPSIVLNKKLSHRSHIGEKKEEYRSTKSSKPPSKDKVVYRSKLDIKIDLFLHGINEDSIIEEQNSVFNKIAEKGINVNGFPQIQIKYGKGVNTTKKGIKNRKYVVTLPKEGGRYKFRREVSKALVRATLDHLKKQQPDVYTNKIKDVFKPSYKITQKALASYLRNSRDKMRGSKISVLKRWGKFSPLYGSKLKPVSFGLVDNTRRPDWQTELAGLVAEIQRKGIKKAKVRYLQERKKAQTSYRYLIRDMARSPLFLKFNINHMRQRARAKARIRATNEMIKKLKALEDTDFIKFFTG